MALPKPTEFEEVTDGLCETAISEPCGSADTKGLFTLPLNASNSIVKFMNKLNTIWVMNTQWQAKPEIGRFARHYIDSYIGL